MSRMLVLKHLLPALLATTTLCQPLLAAEEWGDDSWGEEEESTPWHGFFELSAGARLDSDPVLPGEDLTLADVRAQLEIADYIGENR